MAHPAAQPQHLREITEGIIYSSGLQFGLLALYEVGTLFSWHDHLNVCLTFSVLFALVVAIVLPVWTIRCRTNAEVLHPGTQQRMSSTLAGWSWFIPVGFLWLPYQAVTTAWRASAKNGAGTGPVRLWWFARLGGFVAIVAAGTSHGAAAVLIWLALRGVSYGAFVHLARQLCHWQTHDIEQLAASGAAPAPAPAA
ncbi:hypothetical protein GCM10009665_60550 [Kitasatospora nipponensis]|uniref:DUF4328 domain-containing protein n=1 Tax=Kitasatospora nipponensis TaxID=258049 RepID=A0ABN1WVG3_9ACTN